MNDKQGHLLELKLAAISALEYEDVWKVRFLTFSSFPFRALRSRVSDLFPVRDPLADPLRSSLQLFGEGKHPNFRSLLDNKLSPYLSSHAYSFWRANDQAFAESFYLRG
jgi:betaine lipid synthase